MKALDWLNELPTCIPNMKDFKTYESEHYDFYRFSRLVIDVVIDHHKFSIPYDIELEILYKAYLRFKYSNNLADPYKEQLEFISSDIELLRDLQASNEGY